MVPFSKRLVIVLIDDNRIARSRLLAQIRAESGFEVLAISALVDEALEKIRQTTPDLILLHLSPVAREAVTLAGAIHGEFPSSRIALMGCQPAQEGVAHFVRAGVAGFILETASFETLLDTLHTVAKGHPVLPPEMTPSLFDQLRQNETQGRQKRDRAISSLTKRERDVTELIVQGLSNQAIADRLGIALDTVKSHVHKVLGKLSVNSRLEIAAFSRDDATVRHGRKATDAALVAMAPQI